jgi:hypothetical protein
MPTFIDEERDPFRVAIALERASRSLAEFFARDATTWGADLADPGKRAAVLDEVDLALELAAAARRIAEDVASYALTREDIRQAEAQLGIRRRRVAAVA